MRRLSGVAAALIGVSLFGVVPAHAAGQDAVKDNDEFVLYYNSNYAGSFSDFAAKKSDLGSYDFIKSGLAGYGQSVFRNTASVQNLRADPARVYVSVNWSGASDYVYPDSSRNLSSAYNDNASFQWL